MTDTRLEVWDKPGTAGFTSRIETLDSVVDSSRFQPVNGIGEGKITLPDTFSEADAVLIVDPLVTSNSVRSLIRVYLDGDKSGVDPTYREWLPDALIPPQDSESGRFELTGLGIESIVRDAVTEPWDWDGEQNFQSSWPDWIYGGRDLVGPVETVFNPEIVFLEIVPTGGAVSGTYTFGVSKDGSAYENITITPGDSSASVESDLEALSYGLDVEVSGFGTEDDPYDIRIMGPDGFYQTTISSAGLTNAVARKTTRQEGLLKPVGWELSRLDNTSIPHGSITEFRASLGTGTDPALPAGCSAWIMFNGTEPMTPGVQTVPLKVTPGGIYQLPDDMILRAGTGGALVRVVLRDLDENILHTLTGGEAFFELNLTANTNTATPGIADVIIPQGVSQIILRVGHIGTGDPPPIWVACPSFIEGFEANTIGFIVRELYEDWTVDHAASTFPLSYWVHGDGGFYLALDITDALDSAGNAWPRDEKITIKRGERFDKVLQKIVGLGYEWRVIPAPVDGYWLLQIFTAPTLGVDYSTLDTPTIRGGRDITRRALRRWLPKTGALVEGADQFFSHAADAGAQTTLGVSTDYQVRQDYEPEAATVAAGVTVGNALRRTRSLVVNIADVQEPLFPIPGRTYVAGDTLRVLDPPEIVDDPERVWSILYTRTETGIVWEIQLGNESFASSGSAGGGAGGGGSTSGSDPAVAEPLRWLLDKEELVRNRPPGPPDRPPEAGCCPSCPALYAGSVAAMATGATFLDWGMSNDPDRIMSDTGGNLVFLQAGLYTVQFKLDMRWTLTATGNANWMIYSQSSDDDGLDGDETKASFGVSGGFMRVTSNIYHTAHLAEDGEQYTGGWELLVQESAGMIDTATGVLFRASVLITRHTDGCARVQVSE